MLSVELSVELMQPTCRFQQNVQNNILGARFFKAMYFVTDVQWTLQLSIPKRSHWNGVKDRQPHQVYANQVYVSQK